jgi:hypothetical protein
MVRKDKPLNRDEKFIRDAENFGIDVNALINNLKRTPAERIRRHRIALNTVMKFRKAKKK